MYGYTTQFKEILLVLIVKIQNLLECKGDIHVLEGWQKDVTL